MKRNLRTGTQTKTNRTSKYYIHDIYCKKYDTVNTVKQKKRKTLKKIKFLFLIVFRHLRNNPFTITMESLK